MRFQHGVDDSPTRSPISATDSEASSCRTIRIFRSMASRRRLGSGGTAGSLMGRTLFHRMALNPSYIEKSSMARLSRRAAPAATRLSQKTFNFRTLRGSKGAPEARAFQCRGGGGERQRLPDVHTLGDRERERTVKDVAGAERIHANNRERWRLLQAAELIEPDGAVRSAGAGQEGRGELGNLLERPTVVGDASGLLQRFARENQVRGGSQQALVQRHRAVDADDNGDAAPACLGAEFGAELGAAALGQDGASATEQPLDAGEPDFPQVRIAENGNGSFAAGV